MLAGSSEQGGPRARRGTHDGDKSPTAFSIPRVHNSAAAALYVTVILEKEEIQ